MAGIVRADVRGGPQATLSGERPDSRADHMRHEAWRSGCFRVAPHGEANGEANGASAALLPLA